MSVFIRDTGMYFCCVFCPALESGWYCPNELSLGGVHFFFFWKRLNVDISSFWNVQWNIHMKPSGPLVFFVGRFFIIYSVSLILLDFSGSLLLLVSVLVDCLSLEIYPFSKHTTFWWIIFATVPYKDFNFCVIMATTKEELWEASKKIKRRESNKIATKNIKKQKKTLREECRNKRSV